MRLASAMASSPSADEALNRMLRVVADEVGAIGVHIITRTRDGTSVVEGWAAVDERLLSF